MWTHGILSSEGWRGKGRWEEDKVFYFVKQGKFDRFINVTVTTVKTTTTIFGTEKVVVSYVSNILCDFFYQTVFTETVD